jgi:hypothetical protein
MRWPRSTSRRRHVRCDGNAKSAGIQSVLRSLFPWKPQADAHDAEVRSLLQFPETAAMRPDLNYLSSPRSADIANSCVILSSSRNAVSISSDRTTNLLPLSRCPSTIQNVRPLESTAETQPKLQPALLRLSAMISQYRFTRRDSCPFALHTAMPKCGFWRLPTCSVSRQASLYGGKK